MIDTENVIAIATITFFLGFGFGYIIMYKRMKRLLEENE